MSIRISFDTSNYKPMKANLQRVKDGIAKMQEALINDWLIEQRRPSGLPKDWRNRVFR